MFLDQDLNHADEAGWTPLSLLLTRASLYGDERSGIGKGRLVNELLAVRALFGIDVYQQFPWMGINIG
jgi:hypothetical protein